MARSAPATSRGRRRSCRARLGYAVGFLLRLALVGPGLAMHTLEVELGEPDTPMPIEVGAAAFVLRGKAHEAQDRAYHARIDYEYALKMRANIPFASEAIRRIDRRG